MKHSIFSLVVAFTVSTGAFAQQPAATPKPAASPTPAAKPIFEIARVNPGKDMKTRTMQIETLGRTRTVQIGEAVLTKTDLREASASTERLKVTSGAKPETKPVSVIRFRFTKDGSKAIADLSRVAQGQLLAVLIDGQIVAMPKVTEPITGGEWTVTGNFTADTAKALVAKVNAAK
jgi:preprotein translocase subunit SecD